MANVKKDEVKATINSICQKLHAERIKQGISQQRASEASGLSRTGIRHIESLQTNPTLYSLLKLAKALNVDLAQLLKDNRV